ncbi:MAG: recombinase family protein [Xanthobacteraceae bacterium]
MSLANSVTTAPIVAASYERVSTRIQGQHGFSLGAQHQSLGDFAEAQGWALPAHLRFRDGENENASGKDWDLPDLTRMLDAARRREFSVLVVPDFDRFARDMVKGLVLEDQLKKYGVQVVFQRVPVEDSPEGKLLKTQLYAFAEYDRTKIIFRTTMGRRAKASIGKVVGAGVAPYAYRYVRETLPNGKTRVCGLEPDPATAPIAREALLALRYRSTGDVAAELNRRGIPSANGLAWMGTTLRHMAQKDVYGGTWHYGDLPVTVEPILTREELAQIRAALVERRTVRRGRRQPIEDPFVLRGLLFCSHCRGLLATQINDGYRYYRCGCSYPSTARELHRPVGDLPAVNAPAIEAELWGILNATLLNTEYLAAGLEAARAQHEDADSLRADRMASIETEIAKQRRRLDSLAVSLAEVSDGEFRASIRRQAQDIELLIARLRKDYDDLAAMPSTGLSADAATAITAFADEIRAGMLHASPADQRTLYQLLQLRGTVAPAERHDPQAVRLGRYHRYQIDWQASIALLASDGVFLKITTQSSRADAPFAASHVSKAAASSR